MTMRRFARIAQAFNGDECDEIIREMSGVALHPATVRFEDPVEDARARVTSVIGLPNDHWVAEELWGFAQAVNRRHWHFDLAGYDRVQYGEYHVRGHYDWHMDIDPFQSDDDGFQRKVSVVLMLSHHRDFRGGELQLQGVEPDSGVRFMQGDLLVFPSFLPHRVKPVLAGVRRSVVLWANGPRFR